MDTGFAGYFMLKLYSPPFSHDYSYVLIKSNQKLLDDFE